MKIGGLDIGTTGCKLSVFDGGNAPLCIAYRPYESCRNDEAQQIDPEAVWQGVLGVMAECRDKVGKIDAIGVTSFGESFAILDENDRVLFPAMLYTDRRGAEEVKIFDEERTRRITGMRPHSMYSLPKLMWIKNHRPEIFAKAKRVLLFQDYIVYMLTGVAQIDYSLATRTMGFDLHAKTWSRELFDLAGIPVELMSRPVVGGTPAGYVRVPSLGMSDTLIVTACHDQLAAAVGAGVFDSGIATDGSGTVECTTPVFDAIPDDADFYRAGYAVLPHILPGKYVCYAFSFTGGASLKWFRDKFAPDVSYRELDAAVKNEPGNLLVLPYFAGAATPYMDENARAVMVGLGLDTGKAEMYQAVLEGVAYEMRVNLDHLLDAGIGVSRYYATGGGANSPVWLQIKADVLGRPLVALDVAEAGTVGTVILAGVAVGMFRDLHDGVAKMVRTGKTYEPDPARHAAYTEKYLRYREIYHACKKLM